MVRIIVLIFVFGIASLCVASFIHASTAYAQPIRACPCWYEGYDYPGLEETLGDPKDPSIMLDTCTTKPYEEHECPNPTGQGCFNKQEAEIMSRDGTLGAYALIIQPFLRGSDQGLQCEIYNGDYHTQDISIRWLSDARACFHDIVTYCRDYCMHNPNAQCQ